jgi:hypothetical protein
MFNRQTPVGLQALQTSNVAAAVVSFDGLEGEGDSKRNNGERRQPQVGMDLAIGRAFVDLGKKLQQRGQDALPEVEAEPVEQSDDYDFIDLAGEVVIRKHVLDLVRSRPALTIDSVEV